MSSRYLFDTSHCPPDNDSPLDLKESLQHFTRNLICILSSECVLLMVKMARDSVSEVLSASSRVTSKFSQQES